MVDLVIRAVGVGLLCALLIAACGGDQLSLSEYSGEVAAIIGRVDGRLDTHAAELAAAPPDVEATRAYLDDRVRGYRELVDGIDALDPPEQIDELHATLREILGALLVAEEARAAYAATVETVGGLTQVWEGPESQAVRAAELQAIELCYAAQQQIDDTGAREDLEGIVWIPAEMREVVRVSFDCPE